jgi:hypothetical protein
MMGRIGIFKSGFSVDVGKIKSSTSAYGDTVKQLVLRAKIYEWVGDALLNGKRKGEHSLKGRVFLYGHHDKSFAAVEEHNGVTIYREILR